jgi:hypothetical protein
MNDDTTAAYFCTGVLATPEEITEMKAEYAMPMARIGGVWPTPERTVHRIALAHGLPEIKGFYGCDFRDGEFIREKNATEGTPDAWGDYPPDDIRNQRKPQ